MTTLPTLYKTTKTGAIQTCIISINGGSFTVEWGQLDGAMQTKVTTCIPTNVGRANERLASAQAESEAQAKWASKKKAGYSEDITAPVTVQLPMKVKVYQDQLKNVTFPCYSTPKLNGVNGTYRRKDNQLTLTSRGGETYHPIPHLEAEINAAMDYLGYEELNGELYIQGEHLQDITSAVKKPNKLTPSLAFYVFDIADCTLPYEDRRTLMLGGMAKLTEGSNVVYLNGVICNSTEDIEIHYNECMAEDLEGTVIKLPTGLYQHNVRSSTQFKYKKARDAEFKILSMTIDKNGNPKFLCSSGPDLGTFSVTPKGTKAEREAIIPLFESDYKDKFYTVEFEVRSKSGTPLKPVGIGLRDCDTTGSPVV